MIESGIFIYCGGPGTGKTYLAKQHSDSDVRETGWPKLVINGQGTQDFTDTPVAESIEGCLQALYQRREHVQFIPDSSDDPEGSVESLVRAVHATGRVIVVWDEIGYVATPHSIPDALKRILRTHRHCRVILRATTQYIGDLSPLFVTCASGVFAFRQSSQRAVERLEGEFGIDPESLRSLAVGQFKSWDAWGLTQSQNPAPIGTDPPETPGA